MKELTINQALDLIQANNKTAQLVDLVEKLKNLKAQRGGRVKIENSKEILFIITGA